VGDDVGVANVDGAVGEDGAEERANDAVRLVRAAHVAVADVEEHHRLHPRRGGRREEESGGAGGHGRHSEEWEVEEEEEASAAAQGWMGGGAWWVGFVLCVCLDWRFGPLPLLGLCWIPSLVSAEPIDRALASPIEPAHVPACAWPARPDDPVLTNQPQ
jgi:hypothetical protein